MRIHVHTADSFVALASAVCIGHNSGRDEVVPDPWLRRNGPRLSPFEPSYDFKGKTRLNPFARSWFYNATAVRGALRWLRQSHNVNYANHQHSPGGGTTFARRRHDVANSIFPGIVWWKFHQNPFSRSRERLSHIFCGRKKNKKKQRKQKKHTVKHIRYRLIGGCANKGAHSQQHSLTALWP